MARDLDAGDYLDNANAGNYTSSAFSVFFLLNADTSGDRVVAYKGDYAANGWFVIFLTGGTIRVHTNQSGASQVTDSAAGVLTASADQTILVTRSGTSVKIYVDGTETSYASSGSHTDPASSSSNFTLGRYPSGGYDYDGRISEAALWSAALDPGEANALGKRFSPLLIRPSSLDNYWPLLGNTSPEVDVVGGQALTLGGTPTTFVHPRVIRPRRKQVFTPPAAAATTFGFLRDNAGLGVMGGGPFSRSNAGLGVLA